jgi:hypothetical protein
VWVYTLPPVGRRIVKTGGKCGYTHCPSRETNCKDRGQVWVYTLPPVGRRIVKTGGKCGYTHCPSRKMAWDGGCRWKNYNDEIIL